MPIENLTGTQWERITITAYGDSTSKVRMTIHCDPQAVDCDGKPCNMCVEYVFWETSMPTWTVTYMRRKKGEPNPPKSDDSWWKAAWDALKVVAAKGSPPNPWDLWGLGESQGEAFKDVFVPLWGGWGYTTSSGETSTGGGIAKTKGRVRCKPKPEENGRSTVDNTGRRSDPTDDFSRCKVARIRGKFDGFKDMPKPKKKK